MFSAIIYCKPLTSNVTLNSKLHRISTDIQSLLPFLLLQDSGSDNTLLLLVLLSSFSQTPAGLAPLASTTSA